MAVPKTKADLLKQIIENYRKLIELIDSFSDDERMSEFPAGTMNRNIRDVLAHLYHWHLMFLNWYTVGMKGKKPEMPAKGYSWKDTKELNKRIWEDYQNHQLKDIRNFLDKTHSELQSIVIKHEEDELFKKRLYSWTGSASLAAYIRANTSSHYNWAFKLIKKAKRI